MSRTLIGRESTSSSDDIESLPLLGRPRHVTGETGNILCTNYTSTYKYFYVGINTNIHICRLTRKHFTVNNSFSNYPIVFGYSQPNGHEHDPPAPNPPKYCHWECDGSNPSQVFETIRHVEVSCVSFFPAEQQFS
ncbi:hypothetical protein TNIN_147671 [Trichonephila inaurata madagascariensis]|uniref:Uncharacterized protein n=1 Tax=Trichonephila inaurata madagascariensis TaxID=2747483 RepID=A0A8X7CEQ6_9ARAC|nr:hypothetical protein TNIN_147671 [Trichonephila inaurata madagascariensis]